MSVNPIFAVSILGLTAGVIASFIFGKNWKFRRALDAAFLFLYLAVALAVPACSGDTDDRPEGPDIPYSF